MSGHHHALPPGLLQHVVVPPPHQPHQPPPHQPPHQPPPQPPLGVAQLQPPAPLGLAAPPQPPPPQVLVPVPVAVAQPPLAPPPPPPPHPAITNLTPTGKPRNRSWDENYAELLTYKATHGGSTDVPLTYKNDRILGKWVAHLREHQNQAALSQERRDALNAIGFIWNPHEQKWNVMYQALVDYKASTGHCKVPTNWKNDRKLGKWVMRQREKRKNNLLPDHRLQKLEAMGFVWKIYSEPKTRKSTIIDERWNARYQELIEYRDNNGHCNVPKDYGPLGKWVQEQRVMHQRKLLKQDRKKQLEDVGFIFSYRAQKCQQDWNQMYELLRACSTTTEDGQFKVLGMDTGLSRWVHRQKEAYKTHRLDPGREVLLNKIGFQFPERGAPVKIEGAADHSTHLPGPTATHPTEPTAVAATAESERNIGIQLAEGLEIVAKYLAVTPEELAARLAVQKKAQQPAAPVEPAKPTRESPRRKAGKKSAPLPTQAKDSAKDSAKDAKDGNANKPNKEVNALGRLLPSIVKLKELHDAKDEDDVHNTCLQDAVKCLEMHVRQEKGWDPRPSEGGVYHRLLSLAAELGVLLDPLSERCQSVIATIVGHLDKTILAQKKRDREQQKQQQEQEAAAKEDAEAGKDEVGDDAPAAKRRRVDETTTKTEAEPQLDPAVETTHI